MPKIIISGIIIHAIYLRDIFSIVVLVFEYMPTSKKI